MRFVRIFVRPKNLFRYIAVKRRSADLQLESLALLKEPVVHEQLELLALQAVVVRRIGGEVGEVFRNADALRYRRPGTDSSKMLGS
jgi:hypothetical protein